jgi:hypothetical protein
MSSRRFRFDYLEFLNEFRTCNYRFVLLAAIDEFPDRR